MAITSFRNDFKIILYSKSFETVSNLAAWCFCHYKNILKMKDIAEPNYLGTYYDLAKNKSPSDNDENLRHLNRLQAELIEIYTNPDSTYDWNSAVLQAIEKVSLKPYKDETLLEETLACTIITAFDLSLLPEHNTMEGGWYKERIGTSTKRYPLNDKYTNLVRIFPHFTDSLHKKAKKALHFPDRGILGRTLSNQLKNIFFLEEETISAKHKINVVQMSLPKKHLFIKNKRDRLRIAVSPLTNAPVTNIRRTGEGSCFVIDHNVEYDKKYSDIIINILEQCIKQNVNIVIFPEYMITEHIKQDIIMYLCKYNKGASELLFIVAGSQWISEEDHTNNVSSVYLYNGQYLGCTYKASEYAAFMVGNALCRSERNYTERLSDPGKEILLLDIEKVGRFAFAVCRDVCDDSTNTITKSIVDTFQPDFLFVPAWSNSIYGGFESKFINYAAHGTISILCNCCEPIDNNPVIRDRTKQRKEVRKERIMVGHPVKVNEHGRHIKGKTAVEICPKVACGRICDPEHCVYIVDIEPSEKNLKTGEVFKNWMHLDLQGNYIKD